MKTRRFVPRITALLTLLLLVLLPASASPTDLVRTPLSTPSATATATTGWRWPLTGEPKILTAFDGPAQDWLAGHRGVDLQASAGDVVLAPHRGQITFRATVVDRPVLVIDHGNGFRTSLEPVTSTRGVGEWVEAGDTIGQVSSGAHCTERCVHWGVRLDGAYIDPVLLIRDLRPSILLPLSE